MIWPDRSAPTSCLFFKTDPNERIPQNAFPRIDHQKPTVADSGFDRKFWKQKTA